MLTPLRGLTLMVLVGALGVPTTALAQMSGRIAVGGALFAGGDGRDSDFSTGIAGAGLGVVVKATSRWSFGVETDVPRTRSHAAAGTHSRSDGTPVRSFSRWTFRGSIVTGTVSYRLPYNGPVDLSFVTGFGIEFRRFRLHLEQDILDAAGNVLSHEVVATSYDNNLFHWTQVPIGLDAEVRLTRHVSFVPQFRFYVDPLAPANDGCCDGPHARGRLAVRWIF